MPSCRVSRARLGFVTRLAAATKPLWRPAAMLSTGLCVATLIGFSSLSTGRWGLNGNVADADETDDELDTIVATLELLVDADADATRQCLRLLADKTQARELDGGRRTRLAKSIGPLVDSLLKRPASDPLRADAAILAASLRLSAGTVPTRAIATDAQAEFESRRRALAALIAAEDRASLEIADSWLGTAGPDLAVAALGLMGRLDQPRVAEMVLRRYPSLTDETRPKAIELLTQRPSWSVKLLDAIAR
ncbi:MAG: hypothetical protein ACKO38_10810, partial [Planctomycetota bacterium]